MTVVGNKSDLESERQVPTERARQEYKETFDIDFWEVSAKTGENITEMFQDIIQSKAACIKEFYRRQTMSRVPATEAPWNMLSQRGALWSAAGTWAKTLGSWMGQCYAMVR